VANFEERAPALAATLASLYQAQGASLEARLLKAGRGELQETGYDNWNGGTFTYAFVVNLPVDLFALLGEQQEDIEKQMQKNLNRLLRAEPNVGIGEVVLMPDASLTTGGASDTVSESTDEDHRTWPPDQFRLFLTHVSSIKVQTQSLKTALAAHGIAGFVAHSDIEPTRDWQNVIEGALRTMDALAALVTPDFLSSKWCDQEVGVAVGRNKLVIPVRLGADPHGFLGRYQGVAGKGLSFAALARQLFEILAKHPRTSERLVGGVLKKFEHATSFADAKQRMTTLEMFGPIPLELLRAVEPAVQLNVDLREAFGVPERFAALMRKNGAK
jgi:hypothetical protein